jgi:hypothetical protein
MIVDVSKEEGETITIRFKTMDSTINSVKINTGLTVRQLKETIAKKIDLPVDR